MKKTYNSEPKYEDYIDGINHDGWGYLSNFANFTYYGFTNIEDGYIFVNHDGTINANAFSEIEKVRACPLK